MALLSDDQAKEVKKIFGELKKDVTITLFTQKLECPTCSDAEHILQELDKLSDKISLVIVNPLENKNKAEQYGIDRVPAIIISDGTHNRVTFYGVPSGYEFSSLLTSIIDTGNDQVLLSPETEDFLKSLDIDLHFQVFVTPTCPYCPQAVVLANRLAITSTKVKADGIEANEFPILSQKYFVQGVPRTIINERFYMEGALGENQFVMAMKKALADTENKSSQINLTNYLK